MSQHRIFDSLPESQQELLMKHLELVIKENERVNLTRIDSIEDGMALHIEDSLSALPEIREAPEGLYCDMGSGGGFPGIPIAIATGRKTLLIDSRMRKIQALDEMTIDLGLERQIDTYSGRAELLARTRKEEFSVITARALAKLSVLMELASPLLRRRGRLVCYKANLEDSELAHAGQVQKATGMKLVSEREFQLEGKFLRKIVVFEKVAKPTMKLPRQEGQAQKNPL